MFCGNLFADNQLDSPTSQLFEVNSSSYKLYPVKNIFVSSPYKEYLEWDEYSTCHLYKVRMEVALE